MTGSSGQRENLAKLVLCVGPDGRFLAKTKDYLENSKDVNVVTATSRAEALEKLKSESPAVVICDHAPPDLDGAELLRETRASGSAVPFVMLTAEDRRELLMKAMMKDANLSLQPHTLNSEVVLPELTERLDRALKRMEEQENLERRLAVEELIADVSTRLLDSRPPDIDKEIANALVKVGEFIGALRCYLLLTTPDGSKVLNAYEWPKTDTRFRDTMATDLTDYGWALERLKRGENIIANDIQGLIDDKRATPEMKRVLGYWVEQGLTRLIGVPVMIGGEFKGLFGYASGGGASQWTDEDIRLATIFSNTVAAGLGRLEYEQRLRKEGEKFKAIADYTYNWESWLDKDFKLRWVNPEVERFTGYTVEECMGMPDYPLPLVHEEDRLMVMSWFAPPYEEVSQGDREFRIMRKDGRIVEASVSWRPVVRSDGTHLGYRSSVIDITERKQMEEELQRAIAQLSLSNRVTRHELAHQLTTLRNGFETCRTGAVKHDPTAIDDIDRSIKRMDRLLQLLEDFQNVGDSTPIWHSVQEVAESALQGAPSDVKVRIDVGGLEVLADPMFERVFSHLLENSLAHGVKVKNISIERKAVRDGIKIVHRDDGVGLPHEVKKQLFTRDHRHQPARGLILSSEILEVTGMSIDETGVPGHGARFEIFVPKDKYQIKDRASDED